MINTGMEICFRKAFSSSLNLIYLLCKAVASILVSIAQGSRRNETAVWALFAGEQVVSGLVRTFSFQGVLIEVCLIAEKENVFNKRFPLTQDKR
jgi:hypothetical protein